MSGEPPLEELLPGPAPAGVPPETYAKLITARSGTSFGAGMAILPKRRRAAMHALYAYCRIIDDIADGPFPIDDKHATLDAWRNEIDNIFASAPQSAVGEALRQPVVAYDLPKSEFHLLIEGMAMDGGAPIIAPSRETLSAYTRRVAGAVGILSMRIFGAWRGDVSEKFALSLADALQLTNILRDIEEDAAMGRLYLPLELLAAHGIPAESPLTVIDHPNLPALCRDLGAEARACFDNARRHAKRHKRIALVPALMMMGAYEDYLNHLEALDWRCQPERMQLSRKRKLLMGLKYAFFGPGKIKGLE